MQIDLGRMELQVAKDALLVEVERVTKSKVGRPSERAVHLAEIKTVIKKVDAAIEEWDRKNGNQ